MEIPTILIPPIENIETISIPLPENEILITASTTAVVSVAATLTATAAFKYVVTAMKPILKTAWKKLSQRNKG